MISRSDDERVADPLFGTGYRTTGRLGGGASSEVLAAASELGTRRGEDLVASLPRVARGVETVAREACILATVAHPRLVCVIEMGTTADGRPYFVMPLD
jgi:hypothetical protein